MSSLPEQHIAKLPTATSKDAYRRVGLVLLSRCKGIESEDEIARIAGFGSAPAMHHQLRVWGLEGLLPPENNEIAPMAKGSQAGGERKGRGGGGVAENLPSAAGASHLFQAAIDRLKSDLHYTKYLAEVSQNGRFEATFVYPKEEAQFHHVYCRDSVTAERWEDLCAEQGKDPSSTDTLYISADSRYLGGTSPWPAMPLVRLIAAYCLCVARNRRDIEALLEKLHPASSVPNVEQTVKYLTSNEGLLPTSKKLARVVRGKTVMRGLNAVGEDLFHHKAGHFLRTSREQGIPDEEIVRVLREEYKFSEGETSRLWRIFAPRQSK